MQRMMTWLLEEYLGYDRVEWRWSSWPSVRRGGESGVDKNVKESGEEEEYEEGEL